MSDVECGDRWQEGRCCRHRGRGHPGSGKVPAPAALLNVTRQTAATRRGGTTGPVRSVASRAACSVRVARSLRDLCHDVGDGRGDEAGDEAAGLDRRAGFHGALPRTMGWGRRLRPFPALSCSALPCAAGPAGPGPPSPSRPAASPGAAVQGLLRHPRLSGRCAVPGRTGAFLTPSRVAHHQYSAVAASADFRVVRGGRLSPPGNARRAGPKAPSGSRAYRRPVVD